MFLPRFKVRLSNLHTYYLEMPKLIEFLKNDLFTGYIQIQAEEKNLMIFLDTGQIINCLEVSNNDYRNLTLEELLTNIKKEEFVHVFYLPENTVLFWANLFTGKILYPDLSTEFTDANRLIQKLKRENLTGWMEINLPMKEKGIIYFQNGEIIGTCSSWRKWNFQEGEEFLPEITERISQATFNVYKLTLEETLENDLTVENILSFFQELISALEDVIGEKEFFLLWRHKAIEKAEKYPFLDPFANEFEYKSKKIIYEGTASEKELINGLKEICGEIIKERKLQKEISSKIKELKEKYKLFIEKAELLELFKV